MRPSRRPARRSKRRVPLILGALAIVLLVTWLLGLGAFTDAIPTPATTPVDDRRTDAVVVLTGGSGRIVEGIGLLNDNKAEMLFVSGVYDGIDVRYLLQTVIEGAAGIEHRVEVGNATNTVGNAEETAAWIRDKGYRSLRLVTAAYHMPRSLLEFSSVLDDVEIVPHPVFPEHVKADWWLWPGSALLVIKEYNKYLLAWVRQRLAGLRGVFPADG